MPEAAFARAQRIADAVLYEGYLLYPYRASAAKNRSPAQLGVLSSDAEPSSMRTECLLRGDLVHVRIRFLALRARRVEVLGSDGWQAVDSVDVGGERHVSWCEAVEQEVALDGLAVAGLSHETDVVVAEPVETRALGDGIRMVREMGAVEGRVHVSAEALQGWVRLRVDLACRQGRMHGAHVLMSVSDGHFASLLDPPQDAPQCSNVHAWPVLVGEDCMLSSPFILYDNPTVAPESGGDFFDATEIDEMLTLRVMTLTDEEKREARATDERARRIVERADAAGPGDLSRLHGAVRGGLLVGARVRLAPTGRADIQDMFLAGRVARVERIAVDFDGRTHVAVSIEGDAAADFGRHYYFYPEEVIPL